MLDITVGEVKSFEQLPDDKWVIARLVKRDVIRWVESDHKFNTSTDEVLMKLMSKLRSAPDELQKKLVSAELNGYQFSFTFKILDSKKYAGYIVKARTGIHLCFNNTHGEFSPNKLAKLYLGAGGAQVEKGERMDIDTILGNYVAIKVDSQRNQKTKKVYQQVVEVRELSTEELTTAKVNENEINKIEKAVEDAELRAQAEPGVPFTQTPTLEKQERAEDIPF